MEVLNQEIGKGGLNVKVSIDVETTAYLAVSIFFAVMLGIVVGGFIGK